MEFENRKGLTLIEVLVSLVLSSILIAVLYRVFMAQHRTYAVQEQVVDMQQNIRVAVNRMVREIRMAGFGHVSDVLSQAGGVNGFTDVITPNDNSVTVVGGLRRISALAADAIGGQDQVTLTSETDASEFAGMVHRFISIGGIESNTVKSIVGARLILDRPLMLTHRISDKDGTPLIVPIFKIHAVTYGIRNDEGVPVLFRNLYPNTERSRRETVAENIENLQFEYFDANGDRLPLPIADREKIRMIRVTVRARTKMFTHDVKAGDGFQRRTISSNIHLRNMGTKP